MDLTRREWLGLAASVGAGVLPVGCTGRPDKEATGGDEDVLAQFPGKVAMRVVNDRPPCLETPWRYFQHDFTPNEAFYVRWHLQTVPAAIDGNAWRLRIEGAVDRPLELSMRDLARLGSDEVVAVNQCSGNSRSLFGPRFPGRNGATGLWATPAGRGSGDGPAAAALTPVPRNLATARFSGGPRCRSGG